MKLISEVLQVFVGWGGELSAKITPKEIWPNTPVIQQYLLDRIVFIYTSIVDSCCHLVLNLKFNIITLITSIKRVYINSGAL